MSKFTYKGYTTECKWDQDRGMFTAPYLDSVVEGLTVYNCFEDFKLRIDSHV